MGKVLLEIGHGNGKACKLDEACQLKGGCAPLETQDGLGPVAVPSNRE